MACSEWPQESLAQALWNKPSGSLGGRRLARLSISDMNCGSWYVSMAVNIVAMRADMSARLVSGIMR